MSAVAVNKYREPFDMLVTRGTAWGNPFVLKDTNDAKARIECVYNFVLWLKDKQDLVEVAKRKMKDKRLGCVCKPKLCHADVWARLANGQSFDSVLVWITKLYVGLE